jgi:hypothetical protein
MMQDTDTDSITLYAAAKSFCADDESWWEYNIDVLGKIFTLFGYHTGDDYRHVKKDAFLAFFILIYVHILVIRMRIRTRPLNYTRENVVQCANYIRIFLGHTDTLTLETQPEPERNEMAICVVAQYLKYAVDHEARGMPTFHYAAQAMDIFVKSECSTLVYDVICTALATTETENVELSARSVKVAIERQPHADTLQLAWKLELIPTFAERSDFVKLTMTRQRGW